MMKRAFKNKIINALSLILNDEWQDYRTLKKKLASHNINCGVGHIAAVIFQVPNVQHNWVFTQGYIRHGELEGMRHGKHIFKLKSIS